MGVKQSPERRSVSRGYECARCPGGIRVVPVGWFESADLAVYALFIQTTGDIALRTANQVAQNESRAITERLLN